MLNFDNSYMRELEGLYTFSQAEPKPAPRLLKLNHPLAEELGLEPDRLASPEWIQILAGNAVAPGARPIAQAYAGHQFGNFVPQLGDGRALLLGEVVDRAGRRRDIQLKGSGRTVFSRNGDGKAAIGPMLREYLMGEAMHHLGIATSRALAVVATGEPVYRETTLPGAVLTRVAASHIRVGTFEYVSAHGDITSLKRLADYTIARHFPELQGRPYIEFLQAVSARMAALVADWMGVGFIHGVMNTDNVALSGETLDYGPCAFLEHYHPRTVFSSIDHRGRYAYGNQPVIAQWNLARFAETLLPVLDDEPERAIAPATAAVKTFREHYENAWLAVMRRKLGLQQAEAEDAALANEFLDAMQAGQADFTLAWRVLADAAEGGDASLRNLFAAYPEKLNTWLPRWQTRLACEGRPAGEIAAAIRRANPFLIPRNYLVEHALDAASNEGDLGPFNNLLDALADPYVGSEATQPYSLPAPKEHTAQYQTFCGT
jgi:protein adenylyltransferase